jgi:hypothetical protein
MQLNHCTIFHTSPTTVKERTVPVLIALIEDSMGCSGTAESPEAHPQFFSYNNEEKQC